MVAHGFATSVLRLRLRRIVISVGLICWIGLTIHLLDDKFGGRFRLTRYLAGQEQLTFEASPESDRVALVVDPPRLLDPASGAYRMRDRLGCFWTAMRAAEDWRASRQPVAAVGTIPGPLFSGTPVPYARQDGLVALLARDSGEGRRLILIDASPMRPLEIPLRFDAIIWKPTTAWTPTHEVLPSTQVAATDTGEPWTPKVSADDPVNVLYFADPDASDPARFTIRYETKSGKHGMIEGVLKRGDRIELKVATGPAVDTPTGVARNP